MISTAIVICSVDTTILLDLLFCAKTNPPNKATIGEQKIAPQYQKSKSISYLHASRRRIHHFTAILRREDPRKSLSYSFPHLQLNKRSA